MDGWLEKVDIFKSAAHKILGTIEESTSRIVSLNSSYERLSNLNVKQDDLFRQAFTCLEKSCFRAAHVMAWAAFMDFIEEKIFEDGGLKLRSQYTKWSYSTPEDLRENIVEYQIVEVLEKLNLCAKSERKALHGLLNKRNECAHPTDYYPDLNDTLGYISELLKRVEVIKRKIL